MSIMNVDFDPDKKRIEDIFDGTLQFVIPRYQRTYSWSRDKAEEFYDDFIVEDPKAEDNLSFLGTILFAISVDGTFEVIDGQQRLITITLFFAALRDVLRNIVDTKDGLRASDALQGKIKISSSFGSSYSSTEKDKYKLRVGAEIEQIFKVMVYESCSNINSVKPKNTAEKKVLDAYNFFYRKLKETLDRPRLHPDDKLKLAHVLASKINAIEYIDIRVKNKEVAYNLFESHNAKGVALAKTDLIKSYYFGRLGGSDLEKDKKMDEWDNLLDSLSDNTTNMLPDRFFYYMLQSYYGHFSSSNLYRKIKPKMADHQKFFMDLKNNISLMIGLKNSSTGDNVIDQSLHALNDKLRVNQCFILLLCLDRNKNKLALSIYRKIVIMIEEFTYLYSGVSKNPGNALEKVYSKHAKELEEELRIYKEEMTKIDKDRVTGRLFEKLKIDLDGLKPSFSTFSDAFTDLVYTNQSNKTIIRYTFEKIERFYSDGVVNLSSDFTLDHIIPQSKSSNKNIYHTIGNLVPMGQSTNSAKGSNDPSQEHYNKIESFYSVKALNEQLTRIGEKGTSFNEEDIKDRNEYLADYVYKKVFSTILKV